MTSPFHGIESYLWSKTNKGDYREEEPPRKNNQNETDRTKRRKHPESEKRIAPGRDVVRGSKNVNEDPNNAHKRSLEPSDVRHVSR